MLTTPVGQAQVRVDLRNGTMPGLVAMPRGLGHTHMMGTWLEKG
jgi:anaerobic selenocysteine-containing dehydrogenase